MNTPLPPPIAYTSLLPLEDYMGSLSILGGTATSYYSVGIPTSNGLPTLLLGVHTLPNHPHFIPGVIREAAEWCQKRCAVLQCSMHILERNFSCIRPTIPIQMGFGGSIWHAILSIQPNNFKT